MNTENTEKTFTAVVTGQANTEIMPDQVQLVGYIQVKENDRQAALEKTLTIRSMLIEQIKERHPKAERTASSVSLQERVRYTIGNKQVMDGYHASAHIIVKAPASEAKELLATMAVAEEVNVQNPQFVISRALHDQTQMELIKDACKHARLQAEAMAEACLAKVSHVLSIGEEHANSYAYRQVAAFSDHRLEAQEELFSQSAEERMEDLIGELNPTPVEHSRQVMIRFALEND